MSPEAARAVYERMLDQVGQTILIRRYSGTGVGRSYRDYEVRARVTGYEPKELVGNILQGDRKIIVLGDDIEGTGITLPVRKDDKVVVRDRELNVEAADDSTRRIGEGLVAYEIRARG